MAELPPELHGVIIAHMEGQKDTLATSALVSRAWLSSSRQYLFAWVTLDDHDIWATFLRLLDSPLVTFIASIRTLDISLRKADEYVDVRDPHLNRLILQLPMWPSLQRLRVDDVYWRFISASTATHLLRIAGNITELDLHGVTFETAHQITDMVSRFVRLRKMFLYPFLHRDDSLQRDEPLPDTPPVPRTLKHVRFVGKAAGMLAAWLRTAGRSSCINGLKVMWIPEESVPDVGALLRTLGPTLHDLDLNISSALSPAVAERHIDLSHNTSLRHLTIHLMLPRPKPKRERTHRPWDVLATLGTPITHLTIVLSIDPVKISRALDCFAHLNAALGGPQVAGLARLHFLVYCHGGLGIEEAIRERVPGHDARGVVEVSVLPFNNHAILHPFEY